jgi:glycyl-tRNA synthetase beta chain
MSKRDFLLEIGLEEMPANVITPSMNQLGEKIKQFFQDQKITFGEVRLFSTPRRLAVYVKDVAESQEDIHEEAKGPAKKIAIDENGEWTKAALGFSRGQGVDVNDIYFKEVNGVEYCFVNKFIKGKSTMSILPELAHVVRSLSFPKNMRWANQELRYIRPIKWLLALFGEEIIPFSVANVSTDRLTYGHRFLGSQRSIERPAEYEDALKEQYVIANPKERKEIILNQIQALEEKQQWQIPIDEELLEEVNNLVEYPTALFGTFQEKFLAIPEEVLITTMKEHQRYFPVKNADGNLLPYFVTVRNGDDRYLETVAKGNEKVLRARLADADFFYQEDQKLSIDQALAKLKSIVYHEEIGTLSEKVERVRKLSNQLAELLQFTKEEQSLVDRAAQISKFDLVTQMVYEFPELQGIMGEKYALLLGEDERVARAVNEHYQPRSADDVPAASSIGAVVGIADKLDTIASFFAIDLIPSGSQDPYALRRQALGIVQTLLHHQWSIPLPQLVTEAVQQVIADNIGSKEAFDLEEEIIQFFKLRLKYVLQEENIRYDIVESVLKGQILSLPQLFDRARVLQNHKEDDDFKSVIEALSRVVNIAKKAEKVTTIDPGLFQNGHEHTLYNELEHIRKAFSETSSEEEKYELLKSLRPAIEAYFEHTMVMDQNEKIKNNRLSHMNELAHIILSFANVNEIMVK